jgi:hypothetical protein
VPTAPQLKYNRDNTPYPFSIWMLEGQGLFQVRQVSETTFIVRTLTQHGWIDLIDLSRREVQSREAALLVWLEIQNPSGEAVAVS